MYKHNQRGWWKETRAGTIKMARLDLMACTFTRYFDVVLLCIGKRAFVSISLRSALYQLNQSKYVASHASCYSTLKLILRLSIRIFPKCHPLPHSSKLSHIHFRLGECVCVKYGTQKLGEYVFRLIILFDIFSRIPCAPPPPLPHSTNDYWCTWNASKWPENYAKTFHQAFYLIVLHFWCAREYTVDLFPVSFSFLPSFHSSSFSTHSYFYAVVATNAAALPTPSNVYFAWLLLDKYFLMSKFSQQQCKYAKFDYKNVCAPFSLFRSEMWMARILEMRDIDGECYFCGFSNDQIASFRWENMGEWVCVCMVNLVELWAVRPSINAKNQVMQYGYFKQLVGFFSVSEGRNSAPEIA